MSGNPETRQQGFTLFEVIVAFAVLAVTIPVVLQLYTTSFGGSARTSVRILALLTAESKLAEFGAPSNLKEGLFQGTSGDGWSWRVSITSHKKPNLAKGSRPAVRAYRIEVRVEQRGRTADGVTLRTVRLVNGFHDGR